MSVTIDSATQPLQLLSTEGRLIRADIDTPIGRPSVGRCILLPAFGLTKLDLHAASCYLLANGFEVVRFDPTCHVGASDGEVADFRLGQLAEDIDRVVDRFAGPKTCVVGISLSSRTALRMLSRHDLQGIFFLSPVVNTRQTLFEVCGEDLIGQYLDGTAPDTYSILGMTVNRSFCRDCVEQDFASLESTLVDAAALDVPTKLIVGSQDRWVAIEEVEQVAAVMPDCELVTLDGANHQMFRSPVIFQAYLGALLQEMCVAYGVRSAPYVPRFAEVVRYVNSVKRERRATEAVCS
ncbi:MAG: hypothetical protein KGL51_07010 [Betaproteobacteria bacterium]|nr:hypothetical protein [Betaproteobacteria bacterium]